ncbi:HEPN domain-containing protein [Candidatus Korarchaeum cryptofilum]|uniref:HEPN domain-containing protein n=1 Tax=Candidatus Korarchaeum cryptofilum TaxID=498846 RepID=A0A429G1M4_9CREN|nr:PaREP1 family protein [Candidatus Korarchaeum cryptofilum]RSN67731.1 HEPN domain-containing protein [Candidatus Korarchaeum cryptofilum]
MIVLPKKIERKLKEEAEKTGVSEEELVLEALSKALNEPLDPEARLEVHLKLSEKYMREAEDLLAKGDYAQASEKAWGAAAQIVKALAAREGKELRSHASLWEYVDELAEKLGEIELRHLWGRANNLHQNFYENWMPARDVRLAVNDVKMFVERLKAILSQ